MDSRFRDFRVTTAGLPDPLPDGLEGGVFFLHGQDRFQKDEAIRALVDRYADPGTRDFNVDQLRGSEVDLESLARVLATPPLLAECRVVVVREVETLAGNARFRELLVGLVNAPPPGLVAILEATVPRGSRAKVYRQLSAGARSVEYPEVSEDDVPGWLIARANAAHGRNLEPDAARALAAGIGTDLGVLSRELEKLCGLVEEPAPIQLSHVEAAGTRLPRQDRWKWFDLVGEKRFSEALDGLSALLEQGEGGVSLTIGLATHFLRLGVLVEDGPRALDPLLPPHQRWLSRRLEAQARCWSGPEIGAALMDLRKVDELLKASPLGDAHLLEQWLLGVMARARIAA